MAQQLPTQYYVGRFYRDLMPSVTTHPDYPKTIRALIDTRHCVQGSQTIKRFSYDYLPHPSMVDQDSEQAQARYTQYLYGAEFKDFPAITLRSWVGKMQFNDTAVDLPDRLDYLEQDVDGDGTSLRGAIEACASNVFQTKFHILVADYKGLSGVDIASLSMADLESMNVRATVKQYSRENLVNWNFGRVDGKMQLTFVMLREVGTEFDPDKMEHVNVDSYLILGLDETGYYQQKMVKGERGEKNYVSVGGQVLQWLPVEIIADEQLTPGELPLSVGMLYPICEAALYRYRVSADYKEVLRYLPPTIFTKGWRQGDEETFKTVNGRDFISMGAGQSNNLPNEVDVKIESVNDSTGAYERYFDRNADEVRALGGVFKDKSSNTQTATEADINASEQNAVLETVATQLEAGWRRVLSYCAMFEGVFAPDDVEKRLDEITVSLPRDFATPKLSVDEVRVIMEMVGHGLRTVEQAATMLANGGWDYQDAKDTLAELESATPPPSVMLRRMQQQVDTGLTSD